LAAEHFDSVHPLLKVCIFLLLVYLFV
jgi:hypothetical protein